MLEAKVEVRSRGAQRMIALLGGQLPFVTSLAINRTAKDFQKKQTAQIFAGFKIRRPAFARRAVKIRPFSKKHRLAAKIAIDPPGGRKDIFAKFESRHRKRPQEGRHLAVPIAVQGGKSGVIPKSRRPRGFKIRQVRGQTGTVQLKGRRRTFILRGGRSPGIYQRTGRARRAIRLLYSFKRSVPIDDRLHFIDNAKRWIPDLYKANFRKAFRQAMRTARR